MIAHRLACFAFAAVAFSLAASPSEALDIAFPGSGSYHTGVGSYDVKVADVNQDGRPDILCAIADERNVTLLLNNGGGLFSPILHLPAGTAQALDVGDYDGDGLPDVVSAEWFENQVTLHRNLGGGAFAAGVVYPMGITPRDVIGADLDGDGLRDVAVCTGNGALQVRRGLGSGGLNDTLHTTTLGGILKGIDAGDLDQDGKIDLMVVDSQNGLAIPLHNEGGFVFTALPALPMGSGASDVALRDLDGDGWLDVAVVNEDGTASVARNLQDGTFAARTNYNVGHLSQSIAVEDMNSDGVPDLLVSNYAENSFHVLLGIGNMQFNGVVMGQSNGGVRSAAAGDFDGDGRLDVVTGDFNAGTVHVFKNRPGYQRAILNTPSLNFGTAPQTVSASLDARVTNVGTANLVVNPGAVDGAEFSLVSSPAPVTLAPGTSAAFTIQYARAAIGPAVGAFHFTTSDTLFPVGQVALSGTAAGPPYPHAELVTPSLDFGSALQGVAQNLTARVNNTGNATLIVVAGAVDGTEFSLVGPTGTTNVAPGSFVSFTIRYARTTLGSDVGTFHFTTNDSLLPAGQVDLSGITAGPPMVIVNAPPPVSLVAGTQGSAQIVLRNIGTGALHLTIPENAVDLSETHPDDLGPTSAFPFLRADQSGANWDIGGNGAVILGTGACYNGGMQLTNFLPQAEGVLGLGGRELRLGPVVAPNGAVLTRKIYVPVDGPYARYVDELKNPTELSKIYTMDYIDNAGYRLGAFFRSSSGDIQFTIADDWCVLPADEAPDRRSVARVLHTDGGNDPTGAVHGAGGFPAGDYTRTTYKVTLGPHATASIVQWAIQGIDADAAQATAAALRLAPPSAFEFMDAIDRSTTWNAAPGSRVFLPTAGTLTLAPGDSAYVHVGFDAQSATRDAIIQGNLRIATDDLGNPIVSVPLELQVTGGGVVGIDPGTGPGSEVARLTLAGLVPNPARLGGAGHIAYRLANSEPATITLYDVSGRVLARRTLENPAPGPGSIDLRGFERGRMAAGVVWLRLVQGGRVATQKGILLP